MFLYSMIELYLPTQKFRGVTSGLYATQLIPAPEEAGTCQGEELVEEPFPPILF